MTNPPHDGDEQGTGSGAPRPDPDQQRTEPVPFPDRSGPSPYGPPAQQFDPSPYAAQHGQTAVQAPTSGATRPRKSRLKLYLQLAALVGLVAFAMVLANVLGPTVLDRAAVERDVAVQFEEREGVAIDLTCDAEMIVEDGKSYPCTGVTDDGEDVALQITITDENFAEYTWAEP